MSKYLRYTLRCNVSELPLDNEVIVDLDNENDVAAIDRGFGGDRTVLEATVKKGGKSIKCFFSIGMRRGKVELRIEANGPNRSKQLQKSLQVVPWRPIVAAQ